MPRLSSSVALALAALALSSTSLVAAQDCSSGDAASSEFCSNTAAAYATPPQCGQNGATADDWAREFSDCVVNDGVYGSRQPNVLPSDYSGLCGCYKRFVQYGFTNECQNGEVLKYLAINGFRFGVGQPFLKNPALQALFTGGSLETCTNANMQVNGTDVVYTGPGSLLGLPPGDGPVLGQDTQCIPACSLVCPYDDCAPASAMQVASAALVALMAAVLALAN